MPTVRRQRCLQRTQGEIRRGAASRSLADGARPRSRRRVAASSGTPSTTRPTARAFRGRSASRRWSARLARVVRWRVASSSRARACRRASVGNAGACPAREANGTWSSRIAPGISRRRAGDGVPTRRRREHSEAAAAPVLSRARCATHRPRHRDQQQRRQTSHGQPAPAVSVTSRASGSRVAAYRDVLHAAPLTASMYQLLPHL